ncbi:MAG TPA: DUF1622 domain-containing protein [bacterium]|nr:DUF1622 domain-containing protein [bacterium]HPJ72601.1 DUF1622 domain-containing protein [bacterium]HPQ65628.1 DUF1622 domain-containing protein [bacterium]
MHYYRDVMAAAGTGIDAVGVLIIVVGALAATGRFLFRRRSADEGYKMYRQDLGRAILLGLEFLVAGDIIRTVVVAPTLANVVTLGLIVLIRTFLSMALQMEVEHRWPWQAKPASGPEDTGAESIEHGA